MKKKLILSLSVLVMAFIALIYLPVPILQAQITGFNVTGWSWSDNVGWFGDSSVAVDSNGAFSGYMWNDGIGWINFAPGGTAPDGSTGRVSLSASAVSGWARACSVFVNGSNCGGTSTLRPDSERGGWDGWIKMYNVNYDSATGKFSGFAWGDLNIGWLGFGVDTPIAGTCEETNTCTPPHIGCDPDVSVCGGGGGDGGNITLTVSPCEITAVAPAVPDTLSIDSTDGNISSCSFDSGTCSNSTYTAADTVTLNANYNGTKTLAWTGCDPSLTDNLSCTITSLGNISPVSITACPLQNNQVDISVEIKTGQYGGIKFVKSSGSPYPASSFPFLVTINGLDSINLSFDWPNAQKSGNNFPVDCGDVELINTSSQSVISVSNGGKYRLRFPSKCVGANGFSRYNGIWSVPLVTDAVDADNNPVSLTPVFLDFSDSTHQ